jgi:hypothetical protein
MSLFSRRGPTRDDVLIAEVRRLIRLANIEGDHLRDSAPSRSTGLRRQFKRSHDALRQIGELLER